MGYILRHDDCVALYGFSMDYNIGIDPVHVQRLQDLGAFNGYEVEIKQNPL